ncbi:MAG: radical SAM protein [Candidatus Zixiibacteriota bacterium]|nr:MAG: radical SAM protein [candidate division Zixibacteria bacterium]
MNASVIATFRCNAHCHMCNVWKHATSETEEITPEIVAKLPSGLGRINLTGGEPMLRDDAEELVDILYRRCRKVEISTNGYHTEKLVRIAEKYPRVMIRVSLEGLPALNDRLRGITDGFDHALRTILELKKTRVKDIGFSIVICDRNVTDLVNLYELAAGLQVEFAQSTMHNSWYFHKRDNEIFDKALVAREMERFMAALLTSRRSSVRLRVKDWLRACFNQRLYHYALSGLSRQRCCTAGTDLFFLDPFGNITACNGSDEEWIMGNLTEQSFEKIWNSSRAAAIRRMVSNCRKDCAFIGTARFDMLRNPAGAIAWIVRNKIRLAGGRPLHIDRSLAPEAVRELDSIPGVRRTGQKKLVIK